MPRPRTLTDEQRATIIRGRSVKPPIPFADLSSITGLSEKTTSNAWYKWLIRQEDLRRKAKASMPLR